MTIPLVKVFTYFLSFNLHNSYAFSFLSVWWIGTDTSEVYYFQFNSESNTAIHECATKKIATANAWFYPSSEETHYCHGSSVASNWRIICHASQFKTRTLVRVFFGLVCFLEPHTHNMWYLRLLLSFFLEIFFAIWKMNVIIINVLRCFVFCIPSVLGSMVTILDDVRLVQVFWKVIILHRFTTAHFYRVNILL